MEISRGCNSSFVTIIPKVSDPIGLGDFRPISLIGCYYKIIAKMLAERVKRVVDNVVGEVQNAFIKGRFILDGVLIANETMEFMKNIMKKMGFGDKWCKWVEVCLRSSNMSILVNAEGLNAIVIEAVESGIFRGIKVGENNVTFFEEVSGLRVNYNKSKLYEIGVNEGELSAMALWMGCSVGETPFTYIGLPIGEDMRRINSWNTVVEKFKNRLEDWKAKTMSFGGHLTLVKSVLGKWRWRFKNEGGSLWVRVIKSIHGGSGGVDDNRWDWEREIRGRVCKELDELISVLQNVVVSNNCRDRWRWTIFEDGEFKIKDLSRMVEEKILHVESGRQETLWSNFVP
ncbi:hypothetical protein Tco_0668715 [Tanacetum coccineum]